MSFLQYNFRTNSKQNEAKQRRKNNNTEQNVCTQIEASMIL